MNVNLPAILFFDDYHEIPYFHDNLLKILPTIEVVELGCDYKYIALAHDGLKDNPSRETVQKLLEEERVDEEVIEEVLSAYDSYNGS